MMGFTVGAVAPNLTAMAMRENVSLLVGEISALKEAGAKAVFFPELSVTGVGCEDYFSHPSTVRQAWELAWSALAPLSTDCVVGVGLPFVFAQRVHSAYVFFHAGEARGLSLGPVVHPAPLPMGRVVPASQPPIPPPTPTGEALEVAGRRFQVLWSFAQQQPASDCDLILFPAARPYALGRTRPQEAAFLALSKQCVTPTPCLALNALGSDSGRFIYDGALWLAEAGQLHLASEPFTMRPAQRALLTLSGPLPPLDRAPASDETELAYALSLALWDYLRKSRASGYVLSLSGGADSALCALLVSWMGLRAAQSLGLDGALQALPGLRGQPAVEEHADLQRALLLTAYQPTRHSSETTAEAAAAVADGCHAEHLVLDVDPLVQSYTSLVEGAIGRRLQWASDDLALQNIQARTRSPSIWLLANLRGALLICPSNRSELAVGYTTMDGDSSGGLAPIGGLSKDFVRHFLRWAEHEGPPFAGPSPFLNKVNAQAPTAELRPPEEGQHDEDDLMPYPILSFLEKSLILEGLGPRAALEKLTLAFADHPPAMLQRWTHRFYRLFIQSQWKRQRMALSFHVHPIDLSLPYGASFPPISGAFSDELAQWQQQRPDP